MIISAILVFLLQTAYYFAIVFFAVYLAIKKSKKQ